MSGPWRETPAVPGPPVARVPPPKEVAAQAWRRPHGPGPDGRSGPRRSSRPHLPVGEPAPARPPPRQRRRAGCTGAGRSRRRPARLSRRGGLARRPWAAGAPRPPPARGRRRRTGWSTAFPRQPERSARRGRRRRGLRRPSQARRTPSGGRLPATSDQDMRSVWVPAAARRAISGSRPETTTSTGYDPHARAVRVGHGPHPGAGGERAARREVPPGLEFVEHLDGPRAGEPAQHHEGRGAGGGASPAPPPGRTCSACRRSAGRRCGRAAARGLRALHPGGRPPAARLSADHSFRWTAFRPQTELGVASTLDASADLPAERRQALGELERVAAQARAAEPVGTESSFSHRAFTPAGLAAARHHLGGRRGRRDGEGDLDRDRPRVRPSTRRGSGRASSAWCAGSTPMSRSAGARRGAWTDTGWAPRWCP